MERDTFDDGPSICGVRATVHSSHPPTRVICKKPIWHTDLCVFSADDGPTIQECKNKFDNCGLLKDMGISDPEKPEPCPMCGKPKSLHANPSGGPCPKPGYFDHIFGKYSDCEPVYTEDAPKGVNRYSPRTLYKYAEQIPLST